MFFEVPVQVGLLPEAAVTQVAFEGFLFVMDVTDVALKIRWNTERTITVLTSVDTQTHMHIIRQYNTQTQEIKLSLFICLAHTRGDWVVMNSLSLIFGQLSNTQTLSSTSSLCLENDCMCQVSSRRIIPYDYAIVSSPRPWSCALNCVSQEPVISPSLSPSRPPLQKQQKK